MVSGWSYSKVTERLWYVVATEKQTGRTLYGAKLPRFKVGFLTATGDLNDPKRTVIYHYAPSQGSPLPLEHATKVLDRKKAKVEAHPDLYYITDLRIVEATDM